jgi:hypothetical protein
MREEKFSTTTWQLSYVWALFLATN